METAFIISGKNIKKGLRFDDVSMMQYDVASTIAHIFNLEQPQVWIGRPMKIVFQIIALRLYTGKGKEKLETKPVSPFIFSLF